ncbi:MAG: hypothetical protein HKP23_05210, partial [Flavobacteriaceae bacterium]|nr:hypothetical protein [Eudoraea sp.]NNJ38625.1 hypothetical protein [Flavobacteriaceae bacterium]
MKNWLITVLILSGFCIGNAQNELSAYKYVIVPTKFEGFKKENQYQTSTLIKYLLVERGINAVYEDALPADLYLDKCLGVTAMLVNESGTFTTKAHIAFQDCQLQEVYRTKTGNSKIKDYKGAFQEVIREAFESLNSYTYAYKPKDQDEKVTLSFEDDVKSLEQEGKAAMQEQAESKAEVAAPASLQNDELTWYAQEIPNGFQLVDKSPKVRLRLYHSKQTGVFLAETDTQHGIVYLEGDTWY